MGDHKLLDTTQIVNGIAVLLSFFVGYKYALKRQEQAENTPKKTDEVKGAVGGSTSIAANEPVLNLENISNKYIDIGFLFVTAFC